MSTALRTTPVLMYHSISDESGSVFRPYVVSPASFSEQMRYLHQTGYVPLTVTQFVSALKEQKPLPHRRVILTFDDGYVDFYTQAFPVLKQYGFSATVYFPTRYVGITSEWMNEIGEGHRPILDWDTITIIAAQGIECGAHSHTHPELDILEPSNAREEIFTSKRILEEHLQRKILSFCYPHGYSNRVVKRFVREAGFTSACAGLTPADDLLAIPRLFVTPDTTLDHFAQLLEHRSSSLERKLRPIAASVWRMIRHTRKRLKPNFSF